MVQKYSTSSQQLGLRCEITLPVTCTKKEIITFKSFICV